MTNEITKRFTKFESLDTSRQLGSSNQKRCIMCGCEIKEAGRMICKRCVKLKMKGV